MADENAAARAALKAERGAIPGKSAAGKDADEHDSSVEEDEVDMGDLEDTEEKDDEPVVDDDKKADESGDTDEDEDESTDDDEDDAKNSSAKKKSRHIPIQEHKDKLKEKEEALATIQKERDDALALVEKFKEQLPDDISKQIDEAVKQAGLTDKDGKSDGVTKFFTDLAKTIRAADSEKIGTLEKSVNTLLQQTSEKEQSAKIDSEWKAFEGTFKKEYPNATADQLKTAQELMTELSTTEDVGGKTYIKDGKKVLDPYEFDYIFFKNRKQFEDAIGNPKKRKGPQSGRSQGASATAATTTTTKLNRNSTPAQIRQRERELNNMSRKDDLADSAPDEFEL